MKVLLIDNGGLFTYNMADELEKRGCEVMIYSGNTDMKVIDNAVKKFKPQLIVLSSGPASASSASCISIVQAYSGSIPVFGIGFGMQCIIEAFEGKVSRSLEILHGKTSKIEHDNLTIFKSAENPLLAGCYYSLAAQDVPYCLEISARSEKGVVMAVRHKELSVEGVQFHPESILTPDGGKIIDNLISLVRK